MTTTANTLIHFKQGGDAMTVEVGGKYGACGSVSMVVGTETASTIAVDVTALKPNGDALDRVVALDFHLSDSATTGAVTATAASGGIAAGAAGAVVFTAVTGKVLRAVTNASGILNLVVTHTGVGTYYPVITLPSCEITVGAGATFS